MDEPALSGTTCQKVSWEQESHPPSWADEAMQDAELTAGLDMSHYHAVTLDTASEWSSAERQDNALSKCCGSRGNLPYKSPLLPSDTLGIQKEGCSPARLSTSAMPGSSQPAGDADVKSGI